MVVLSGVTPINQRQHSVNLAAQTLGNEEHLYLYTGFTAMMEAVSLGLMDVYLMDRCRLLLWRRSVKSRPAAPAAAPVFSLLLLSRLIPLVWFSSESRAANARNQFKG